MISGRPFHFPPSSLRETMGLDSLARSTALLCLLVWCPSLTEVALPAEFGDVELSAYALRNWPRDLEIFNQGTTVPGPIQNGLGAGLKVGLFPAVLRRIVGLEIDSNAHSGALSFPNIANGRVNEIGRSDLLVSTTTFNLVLRYPSGMIRPYIGIGLGWSRGTLLNPNIAGRDDKDFDAAHALAHQFFGGAQILLSPKVFLFGEYRYFLSNYHWEGLNIDFRTHYGLVGAGLHF